MKAIHAWTLWKAEINDDGTKRNKIPYQVNGIDKAKSNDSNTWYDFQTIQEAYEKGLGDGVMIMLDNTHPLYTIDMDNVKEHRILEALSEKTYCEYSPSGNGVHAYLFGDKPKQHKHKAIIDGNDFELYSHARPMTVTGHRCSVGSTDVLNNNAAVEALINDYFKRESAEMNIPDDIKNKIGKSFLSQSEVIKKIINDKKRGKDYELILKGDWEESRNKNGDSFPSQSESDQALMNKLAFYTSGDHEMMYEIWCNSGAYRKEKDHKNGGIGKTIEKAISGLKSVYNPKYSSAGNYASFVEESNDKEEKTHTRIKKPSWWSIPDDERKSPKFLHNVMADFILQEYHIVRYPDQAGHIYIYNSETGVYEIDATTRKLRSIIRKLEFLKNNSVREVRDYIVDMCEVKTKVNEQYAAVKNGLIKYTDGRFKEFTPDVFVTSKIPTNYNSKAYDDFVHQTITKAACGHYQTIENIKETFAMVLYPKLIVHKIIFFLGINANNGKSTIQNLIRSTFDSGGQISAVSPQRLSENSFAGSSIYGKMANMLDELTDEVINDGGYIKTAVTGGWMEIEAKGQRSKSVQMQTPFIFASNHYPRFKEHGEQINKRLHILPFEYDFKQDENFMNEKESMELIQSESAKEYVLKLAVEALIKIIPREKEVLTSNPRSIEALSIFNDSNNPLSDYLLDRDKEYFISTPGNLVYQDYQHWADKNGIKYPVSKEHFKTTICSYYGITWKTQVRYKVNGRWTNKSGFTNK